MAEKLWYLKQCGLFERLSAEELHWLESRCRARTFSRRSPIYLPADQSDAVLLLVSGRAKICHLTNDGKQAILAFIEPGELFGELAVLSSSAREEYAEAIESSSVVLIPSEALQKLMEAHADLTLGITRLIGWHRRRIERRLKSLLFHSSRDRLVHLLLELAEQYGKQADDGLLLNVKLSHQDLANVIGSTRETVTVVLGDLASAGLLRIGRRQIVLCDLAGLAATSQQPLPPSLALQARSSNGRPGGEKNTQCNLPNRQTRPIIR